MIIAPKLVKRSYKEFVVWCIIGPCYASLNYQAETIIEYRYLETRLLVGDATMRLHCRL